jgi:hypothetical protein
VSLPGGPEHIPFFEAAQLQKWAQRLLRGIEVLLSAAHPAMLNKSDECTNEVVCHTRIFEVHLPDPRDMLTQLGQDLRDFQSREARADHAQFSPVERHHLGKVKRGNGRHNLGVSQAYIAQGGDKAKKNAADRSTKWHR